MILEIDRHEAKARSTTGSIHFSSDFVDPSLSPLPGTALSTTIRRPQRPVSQPGMGIHYVNPPGLSNQRVINLYPDDRQHTSHWSYPPYNHQQPVYSNATYVNAPTPWHSPYQWSNYFSNQPTQQLSQQMMTSTTQQLSQQMMTSTTQQLSQQMMSSTTQQLSQQMMTSTVQTPVTPFGGGHNLNVQTRGGNIQIINGGNNQMISIIHNF